MIVGKRLLVLGCIVLMSLTSKAQEPFFSQFYNSPLTLNPALTGIAYGQVRVASNYKNYLSSVDPFTTIGASVDMSLFDADENPDFGGLGVSVVQAESGFNLTHLKAMLSLSYHNAVGKNSYLALGLQAGVDDTRLNNTNLSTQSQWVPLSGYDPTLASNESFDESSATTLDFNAGLLWYSFLSSKTTLFAGVSVFHISEPEKSFLGEKANLARKYLFHGGGKLDISSNVTLVPNMVYFYQNGSHIINPGVAVEYAFSSDIAGSLGGWVRNTDAFIAGAGLEYANLAVGLSYDLYVNNNELATNGGYEVSLTYHFNKKLTKKTNVMSNPSPRL
ncbi:type IX secretion system membrane protein PorP/SprF [Fulvivirga sp. RKSG066]|uniref:PorP/SprF family type IX secretion system membrane protein n=1 Tax=Fulvivirga aurantia TaxID=2529383 RepID=UPI0012BBF70A|nr:PorP/SprF family type IX secretion system membrane protein [Fulvivirga aurantia]MTI20902.1 type IX secretion system membrane protein PorP/SprF [Fulvivirga aurantia]